MLNPNLDLEEHKNKIFVLKGFLVAATEIAWLLLISHAVLSEYANASFCFVCDCFLGFLED